MDGVLGNTKGIELGAYLDAVLTVFNPRASMDVPDELLKDCCVVQITNGRGLWVMRVYYDGRLKFHPDFTPDAAAQAFRAAMNLVKQPPVFPTVMPTPRAAADQGLAKSDVENLANANPERTLGRSQKGQRSSFWTIDELDEMSRIAMNDNGMGAQTPSLDQILSKYAEPDPQPLIVERKE